MRFFSLVSEFLKLNTRNYFHLFNISLISKNFEKSEEHQPEACLRPSQTAMEELFSEIVDGFSELFSQRVL